MQFDALFRGVGKDLVTLFGSDCTYHQNTPGTYDPLSGAVTAATTDYPVKVGVEEIKRVEGGGTAETHEATAWFSHVLLPVEPTTADTVTYQGRVWKITAIEPEYVGDVRIAWKTRIRSA